MFPDGDDGFRSRKEKQSQTFLDEKDGQEDREAAAKPADGFFNNPESESKPRQFGFQEADDDFMNVASAPGIEATESPNSKAPQDRRGIDTDEQMQAENMKNDSFTE